MISPLNDLNSSQREAVEALEGPLLIVAGAGSGKTRVLTHRIAELFKKKKAYPENIFAVTFTNKAAREMKERLIAMLGEAAERLLISTFHSACVRILRKEIDVLGYDPQFVIYDDHDQLTLIKQCLKRLNVDESRVTPRGIQSQIEKIKNRESSLEEFLKKGVSPYEKRMGQILELYQTELKKNSALDFGDLLSLTVHIFKKHPQTLEKYRNQFRYCLVDEYQDTNHIQYLLVKLLCERHQNLCVVGDEDQSIYSWRGADISNILSFEKDFPTAKVIKLEQNYRSTRTIIEASSYLISHNRERKPKKLWTDNEKGRPIQVIQLEDEYGEARFIAEEILKQKGEGGGIFSGARIGSAAAREGNIFPLPKISFSNFAIFYRTNAQSRVFEEVLRERRIPYQILGGVHFYGRAEIKDVLCYLRLILNPKDNVSFARVVNVPSRGIGKVTLEKIAKLADQKNCSWFEAAKHLICHSESNGRGISSSLSLKLKDFIGMVEGLIEKRDEFGLLRLYHEILDQTQYVQILKEEKTIEALSRVENLEELDSAITEFVKRHPDAGLERYLEEISLVSDSELSSPGLTGGSSDNVVKMMTFHVAKGLEFPTVFMVGLEEGLFPYHRIDLDLFELEEERRLCYVGMTRARQNLYLTRATSRRIHGAAQFNLPSRFLDEIPKEYLEEHAAGGKSHLLWRGTGGARRGAAPLEEGGGCPPRDRTRAYLRDDDFNQEVPQRLYATGERVRHGSFGIGVICRVEGEEEHTKVTIKFDNGYVKKFLAMQAPLQKLERERIT